MRIYKLSGTVTATASAIANVLTMQNGRIRRIHYSARVDAPADNAAVAGALSLSAIGTIGTSESVGDFCEIGTVQNILTSGGGTFNFNGELNYDLPIRGGERIYLHGFGSGTVSMAITFFIHVEEGR